MQRYQKTVLILALCLVFTGVFLRNTRHDFPLIFHKDLLAHDESSNSVVAANITRKFFPPMVRVNPWDDQQKIWMEGPRWQHIPPLFAYVPYVFFKLDGQITIELKRLAYAFVVWLTGLLFIFSVYKYRNSLLAGVAATIGAVFWVNTSFTHELITGYAFGVSDIVLAFTMVCAFAGIIWYLQEEKTVRRDYPWLRLGIIAVLVALPIMAKNILGAIPAATFFLLLLADYGRAGKRFWQSLAIFSAALLLYYVPLALSSWVTFKKEILVSFFHVNDYEGWGRPWHYYLTNYLPHRYLFGWTWVYFAGLIFAAVYNLKFLISKQNGRKIRITSAVALIWFCWNLLAVSLVRSKIPNFIYQTYLLSLYAIAYSVLVFMKDVANRLFDFRKALAHLSGLTRKSAVIILIVVFCAAGYEAVRFVQQFRIQRAQAYNYQSEHEKFYHAAEEMRAQGLGPKDLVIIRTSDNDCWFRYYSLFLTGAESRTLLETDFDLPTGLEIKNRYQRVFFLVNKNEQVASKFTFTRRELSDYSLIEYDLPQASPDEVRAIFGSFLSAHQKDILQDIARIKADKTSCQWLVPDSILNAP